MSAKRIQVCVATEMIYAQIYVVVIVVLQLVVLMVTCVIQIGISKSEN